MNKFHIAVILGTRPEIIRLSRVISVLRTHYDLTLIHTGQNYTKELSDIFFSDLEIPQPDYYLDSDTASLGSQIGTIISSSYSLLSDLKPDAVLILGDTNSALSAISAKRLKIPIFHMEAGNRCYDQNVPEEINRKIVDHISDINLTYSQISRDVLLRESIPSDRVVCIGSPLGEVINYYLPKIQSSTILNTLNLTPNEYLVVSSHRQENIDDPSRLSDFFALLNYLVSRFSKPIIVSTHPRLLSRIPDSVSFPEYVTFAPPFAFTDYCKLQINSCLTLSDSGSISEEASILNFPAINLRNCQERHEAIEEGVLPFTGFDIRSISNLIEVVLHQSRAETRDIRLVYDYSSQNTSQKLLRIIPSYINYVNQYVWNK